MSLTSRKWRRVDGVLLVGKPAGASSNAALQRARRAYQAERAGHTGTLDPMASGLLVMCFGEATKFSSELLDAGKCYTARVKFGVRTSTADAEGEILERRPVSVTMEQLHAALERFRGTTSQIPPMYSALKKDGRPLYEYARRGQEVERAPRTVTLSRLELTEFAGDEATVLVACSKGTYVRTLAEDIGEALGCGAHLVGLERTSVGEFELDQAYSLDTVESATPERRADLLQPVEVLVRNLPVARLSQAQTDALIHGQPVRGIPSAPGRIRIHAPDGRFLGVGISDGAGTIRPKRLLSTS